MSLDSNANVSNSKVNLLQCQNTVLMGTLSTRVFGSTIKVMSKYDINGFWYVLNKLKFSLG